MAQGWFEEKDECILFFKIDIVQNLSILSHKQKRRPLPYLLYFSCFFFYDLQWFITHPPPPVCMCPMSTKHWFVVSRKMLYFGWQYPILMLGKNNTVGIMLLGSATLATIVDSFFCSFREKKNMLPKSLKTNRKPPTKTSEIAHLAYNPPPGVTLGVSPSSRVYTLQCIRYCSTRGFFDVSCSRRLDFPYVVLAPGSQPMVLK